MRDPVSAPPEGRSGAPRVSFFTLGCRLNQFDTAAMRAALERAGWAAVRSAAESGLLVVNTCTVTKRADQEARQLIRRLSRERPGAAIVVTGCYAQRAPEELRGIPGVRLVLGTAERERIATFAETLAPGREGPEVSAAGGSVPVAVGAARARRPIAGSTSHSFGRARALLKVQDGCDSFCTYCVVPYVRGRSRSLPIEDALEQARRLLDAGFCELVLTGADLGSYGHDLGARSGLGHLVERLLALGPDHRLRLSSIEPNKIDAGILDLLGREPRLCRHLHLPLQSGSTTVLRAMRRGYSPDEYAAVVERAASRGPVGIGADVIVGFPGEGESEFEETAALVSSLPITYLHVFRYSPRPGTFAVRQGQGAPDSVARLRSERLREIGDGKRRSFLASLVGKALPCVMEGRGSPAEGFVAASDVYAPVRLPSRPPRGGRFVAVITGTDGVSLSGVAAPG